MLSRAFTKPRKSPRDGENSGISLSLSEYEDSIFGLTADLPLIFCDDEHEDRGGDSTVPYLTLRGVLRASVGVMGESRLGITEKVVLWRGKVCAVKRLRKVRIRRSEFGRRVKRLAVISRRSEYLVPITAYLYAKRIKFIVCDYYPMGSLADLLSGAREIGHTALDWNHRFMIILNIAKAIAFIHSQSLAKDKNLQLNVHGNIKASNVMINVDFTACLSEYGFTQLAEREEISDTWQQKPLPLPLPPPEIKYQDTLCQTSDIYSFGIIVLDMLGGPKAPTMTRCIAERKEDIKAGVFDFFEFSVEGKARKQALQVLDIALACTNSLADARPSTEKILMDLGDVLGSK